MKQLGIPLWRDEQKAFETFEQANKYTNLDEPVRIDRSPGDAEYKYLANPKLLEKPTTRLMMEWKTTIDPIKLSMKGYHEI